MVMKANIGLQSLTQKVGFRLQSCNTIFLSLRGDLKTVQQRLGLLQILCVNPFGEPVIEIG